MKHCVIYSAKSNEDTHGSIPTQINDCSALAHREGWVVVGTFSDEAFSAYSGNRGPALEQAKALAASTAAQHGVCILAAQDSDRFARGAGDAPGAAEHLGEVYFQMKRQNVELWTVRSGRLDLLRATLEGERSHDESARKAQATKAGLKRAAERGHVHGGVRPFGYRYSGDKNDPGRLEVVPEEADQVRRMFQEYSSGRTMSSIARRLHEDGVPTVTGGQWRMGTIGQTLRRRVYLGMVEFGGEVFEGTHEPIVDAGLWQRVQDLFEARPAKGRGRPTKGSHLFRRGTLRCSRCGEAMVPATDRGNEYYFCNGRKTKGKEFCPVPNVPRADLDSAVYSYFEKVALDLDATRAALEESSRATVQGLATALHSAEKAEREASESLVRMKRDYMRGALDAETFNELRAVAEGELAGAVGELERLREQQEATRADTLLADIEAETLHRLAELRVAIAGEVTDAEGVDAVRVALMRMFVRFEVYADESGEGRINAIVRDTAAAGIDEDLRPVLEPVGLELENPSSGTRRVDSKVLFGPIPLPATARVSRCGKGGPVREETSGAGRDPRSSDP